MAAGRGEEELCGETGYKSERARKEVGVPWRALLLGLILVPFNAYLVMIAEVRWYILVTLNPLFVIPIFALLILVGFNTLWQHLSPQSALRPGELVVIYVMLVMSCTIVTHDFLINLLSIMPWPRWYATPENGWETRLFPYLPKGLMVWNKPLLAGFFQGNSRFHDPAVVQMWFKPLALWSIFIFAAAWVMLCLNSLLRRAWVDQTRLSFPIVRLPLALTEGFAHGSMLCTAPLWLGFAVAGGINLLNGFQVWFPFLPRIPVGAHWFHFPTPPLSAAGTFPFTFYPYAIGLAFLVPLDVSFSCWFFYLFIKVQSILGYLLGYGNVPDFPYVSEQGIGAWLAFGVVLLWTSRHYLAQVVRLALQPRGGLDRGEPLSYRTAFWGSLVGTGVLVGFWGAAGMSLMWALVGMGIYLLVSLCIARVRAEAGGQHTVWDLEPKNIFRLFDSWTLGPANLGVAAVSHWYWRLNRGNMMPNQLEGLRLAQEHQICLRSMVVPMLAALVLSMVFGAWAALHLFYQEGALAKCRGFAQWMGQEAFGWLEYARNTGFSPEASRWGVVGASAGLIFGLSWLRGVFVRFPFHPLGYCIGPGLIWHWFPFCIAWGVKWVILRYGGLRFYRRALPFFLGLTLGDYTFGAVWTIIGVLWHVPTYQFQFF